MPSGVALRRGGVGERERGGERGVTERIGLREGEREDMTWESRAAVAGGVWCVVFVAVSTR